MQDVRPHHNDNVQLLLPPINPPPHLDTFIEAAPATFAVSAEYDRRRTDFLSIKAEIVLQVCFRYGLHLLGQKKHKMLAQVMLGRAKALLTRQ